MKKTIYLSIICICILTLKLTINHVKADSGWDYSYDASDSYSSSRDYSSNYSSSNWNTGNYSSSHKINNPYVTILSMLFILFILAIREIISLLSKKATHTTPKPIKEESLKIIPYYNKETFGNKIFEAYKQLLLAWTNLDKESASKILESKFYSKFIIAVNERKNIQEIINEPYLLKYNITKSIKTTYGAEVTVSMNFKCKNCLIDKTNNQTIVGNINETFNEYAEVIFHIDKDGTIKIIDRLVGMPYFSNNTLEKNIKIDINEEIFKQYEKNITINELKKETFKIYKTIQEAWMNFDYELLKQNTTDELFNLYKSDLKLLSIKKQKNIMKDITYKDCKILDISSVNNIKTIKTYLEVSVYDYVVDANNKVIRGDNKHKINIKYYITLVKNENIITKCPSCNANISNITSGKCPYCNVKIINNNYKFVMSKKECLEQNKEKEE